MPETGRYDMETFNGLEYLIEHKKLPECWKHKKLQKNLLVNICKFNKTRWSINQRCFKQLYKSNEIVFKKGMKVISNISNNLVSKSQFYYIVDIIGKKITITNIL